METKKITAEELMQETIDDMTRNRPNIITNIKRNVINRNEFLQMSAII